MIAVDRIRICFVPHAICALNNAEYLAINCLTPNNEFVPNLIADILMRLRTGYNPRDLFPPPLWVSIFQSLDSFFLFLFCAICVSFSK